MTVAAAACVSGGLITSVCHPPVRGDPVTPPASASAALFLVFVFLGFFPLLLLLRGDVYLRVPPPRSALRRQALPQYAGALSGCESGIKHLSAVAAAAQTERDVGVRLKEEEGERW